MANILFRVDGSSQIGIGHMMRTSAIAATCSVANDVTILTKTKLSYDFFLNNGYRVIRIPFDESTSNTLQHNYGTLDEQLEEMVWLEKTSEIMKNWQYVFLDTYNISEAYCMFYRQYGKVVLIEDLPSKFKEVDYLINYNVYAPKMYEQNSTDLIGCEYFPARNEFNYEQKDEVRDFIGKILITSGGSDPYGISRSVAEIINEQFGGNIDIQIVIGSGFTNISELESYAVQLDNVQLHYDVKNMKTLFEKVDLVITTAGTTMYELSLMGVPALSLVVADNQLLIAKSFEQLKLVPLLGDVRTESWDVISKIIATQIKNLSFVKRQQLSARMKMLIDGKGCYRIMDKLGINY